ncbi:unnamed protein product, partial [Pleuronectes platessa]
LWFVSGSTPRRNNKKTNLDDLSKNPRGFSLPCLVPQSKAPYSPNICSPGAFAARCQEADMLAECATVMCHKCVELSPPPISSSEGELSLIPSQHMFYLDLTYVFLIETESDAVETAVADLSHRRAQ